jgi:asparagine synthase (glutamine-hydrolysing)
MCGISGIIGEPSPGKLKQMLDLMFYRGPDETISFHDNVCSIGSNRLKIKGGSANKIEFNIFGRKIVIVLNGEVYNYKFLFERYSKNTEYCFKTDLELELLALMYVVDGESFVSKVDGMFAIAIYEFKKLILYRDRQGIKPLYYSVNSHNLIFSSEIKSIVSVDEKFHDINRNILIEQLLLSFAISENETILEGIYQVPPGNYLVFEDNIVSLARYYCFSPCKVSDDIKENTSITENLLEQSIDNAFSHDNSTKGLFLSGGLDSSLIAIKASRASLPFSAYTLDQIGAKNSEDVFYAKKLAEKLKFNHKIVSIDTEQAINNLVPFTYFYENIDFSGIFSPYGGLAFYLIAQKLSTYHKVAISGDGADELFAGYQYLHGMPHKVFDNVRNKSNKICDLSGYKEHLLDTINRTIAFSDEASVLYDLLVSSSICNFHLPCLDKCTSCFSMELRPIYLDNNLYEYVRSIGLAQKMHQGENKYFLKEIGIKNLTSIGLGSIIKRKKMAMPSALDKVTSSIDNRLKDLYSFCPQSKNKFSGLFYTLEQKILFDLFYYIFVYKKCNGDIKDMLLSDIINSQEFNKMYV